MTLADDLARFNAGVARARAAYNATACGTPAGHSRHRRDGTPPCLPCLAADNEKSRERYNAQKGATK